MVLTVPKISFLSVTRQCFTAALFFVKQCICLAGAELLEHSPSD